MTLTRIECVANLCATFRGLYGVRADDMIHREMDRARANIKATFRRPLRPQKPAPAWLKTNRTNATLARTPT